MEMVKIIQDRINELVAQKEKYISAQNPNFESIINGIDRSIYYNQKILSRLTTKESDQYLQ